MSEVQKLSGRISVKIEASFYILRAFAMQLLLYFEIKIAVMIILK